MQPIHVIDSHTGGEPTRVVLQGGPDLGDGPLAERARRFRRDHDPFRSAVVNEPRGSEVLVGVLLAEPLDPEASCGAIFFNNVGTLGMCGHATIGLIHTLAWLGRIDAGTHRVETPVGTVRAELLADGSVEVANVPSWRHAKQVPLRLPADPSGQERTVHGDVAWGGNWFYLCHDHGLPVVPERIGDLTALAARIRRALAAQGVTGAGGAEIDHVELAGEASAGADGRGFVLCPGLAYDRSPCGTGTSAIVACLAADGRLAPNATWVQESVIGSRFKAHYRARDDGAVDPFVRGRAYVTAEATLLLDPADPYRHGLPSHPSEVRE